MSSRGNPGERVSESRGVPASALWTLPNALTLLRIFLVPVLMVFLLTRYTWAGLTVFLAASFTDWLDGHLARKRMQVTNLGKLLDPLADKLLVTAAFVSLVELDLAPAWIVVVIIGRELAMTGLRGIAADQNVIIPASRLGKYKLAVQVVAVSILILSQRFPELVGVGQAALWVVLVLSMWSAANYFREFWGRIGNA
jgi:CDP-diacylglycerol--glycerol-3-phosphate 3-phosphatidyltransferase